MDLQPEQIERQFDRAAATYDSVASLQRQMAERLLERIPTSFEGPLIDLGCGTGDLLWQLSQRTAVSNLTGIDISSAMLNQARNRVPGLQTIKADLAALPLESDSFQWAASNAAIQWCDAAAAFSELRRVLRPGGRAFISTFGPDTMKQWRSAFAAVSSGDRVHSFPTVAKLATEFEAAGFSNVETETETIDVKFDSVRAMFDSVRKLGATNARSDRPTGLSGRKWLQQVTDAFEQTRDSNGLITLTYECCYLIAY